MAVVSIEAELQRADFDNMVDRVESVLTPTSLERYLQGPGHAYFSQKISENFEVEGSAAVGRWEPLHDPTQDIREALGYSPTTPINRRTGEMFEVLTKEADFDQMSDGAEMTIPGRAGSRYPVSEKIKTAQLGRNNNFIPEFGPTEARPILGISSWDAEIVMRSLEGWIMSQVAGSFGTSI